MAGPSYRHRKVLILFGILIGFTLAGAYYLGLPELPVDKVIGKKVLVYARPVKWDFNQNENMYHLMVHQLVARNILKSGRDGQVYSGLAETWEVDPTAQRISLKFSESLGSEDFRRIAQVFRDHATKNNPSEFTTIFREHGMIVSADESTRHIGLRFHTLPPALSHILTHPNLALYPRKDSDGPVATGGNFAIKEIKAFNETCQTIHLAQTGTATESQIDVCQDPVFIRKNLKDYDAAFNLPVTLIPEFENAGYQRLEVPKSVFLNAAFDPRNKFLKDIRLREHIGCGLRKAFEESLPGIKHHPHIVPAENNEYLSESAWRCDSLEKMAWPPEFRLRIPFSEQFFPEDLKERILWNLGVSPDRVEFVSDSYKLKDSVDVFFLDWISSFPDVEFDLLMWRKENLFWYPIDERPLRNCLQSRREAAPSADREKNFAHCLNDVEKERWVFPVFQEATYFYVKEVKDIVLNRFRVESLISDFLLQ